MMQLTETRRVLQARRGLCAAGNPPDFPLALQTAGTPGHLWGGLMKLPPHPDFLVLTAGCGPGVSTTGVLGTSAQQEGTGSQAGRSGSPGTDMKEKEKAQARKGSGEEGTKLSLSVTTKASVTPRIHGG